MKAKVLLTSLPLPCVLCLGYICGIGLSAAGGMAWPLALLFAFGCLVSTGRWPLIVLLTLGLCGGIFAGSNAMHTAKDLLVRGEKEQPKAPLVVEATQAAEKAGDKVLLAGKTVTGEAFTFRIESRNYFPALPGDRLRLEGTFGKLEKDEESTFNYPIYLAKGGVAAIFRANSGKIEKSGGFSPARLLAQIRRASLERVAKLWPGDEGGLIAGILVGARGSFSDELVFSMRNTGLMHIVAVSGSNMTILINAILVLCARLSMRWKVLLATIALVLFTFFVGPSGAVVRACLMGIIALVAKLYARPSTAFLCLVYAATLMLLFSPLDMLYDIGFQLSFLAVLGLLWGEPCMEPFCRWIPAFLADELRPTLAAITWTLPISIVYFGNVSLIAPLANLLIPPSIPLLMLGGFVTFVFSWIPGLDFLVWLLATLVGYFTSFVLWVTDMLAHIPFAALPVTLDPHWALPFALTTYTFLAWWAWKSYPTKNP